MKVRKVKKVNKNPERTQEAKKGISDVMLVPLFLLVGILTISVFTYFYWNKLGHSRELMSTMAADRTARAVNIVSSYQGEGSLEVKFTGTYEFEIADNYVVASRKGKSGTSYFFVEGIDVENTELKTDVLKLNRTISPQGRVTLSVSPDENGEFSDMEGASESKKETRRKQTSDNIKGSNRKGMAANAKGSGTQLGHVMPENPWQGNCLYMLNQGEPEEDLSQDQELRKVKGSMTIRKGGKIIKSKEKMAEYDGSELFNLNVYLEDNELDQLPAEAKVKCSFVPVIYDQQEEETEELSEVSAEFMYKPMVGAFRESTHSGFSDKVVLNALKSSLRSKIEKKESPSYWEKYDGDLAYIRGKVEMINRHSSFEESLEDIEFILEDSNGNDVFGQLETQVKKVEDLTGQKIAIRLKIEVLDIVFSGGSLDEIKEQISPGNYKLSIEDKYGLKTEITNFEVTKGEETSVAPQCVEKYDDGVRGDFRVAFAGSKYEGENAKSKFVKDVGDAISGILSIEPFKSNREKFDFYYSTNPRTSAEGDGVPSYADVCDARYKVYLINKDFGSSVRYHDGRIGEIARISLPQTEKLGYKTVIVHEFAHAFGKLEDEYVGGGGGEAYYDINPGLPNCVEDREVAEDHWGRMEGKSFGSGTNVGYYKGCGGQGGSSRIEPHDQSIMDVKEYSGGLERGYGPVSERWICYNSLKSKQGICERYYNFCNNQKPNTDCEVRYS